MNRRGRRVLVGGVLLGAVAAGGLAAGLLRGPGDPRLAAIRVDPPVVVGCQPAAGAVSLDRPAPDGGTVVDLDASSTAADVPAQVTVPAGVAEQLFTVGTRPVAVSEEAEVRATLGTATQAAVLRLDPVEAATLGADPSPACLAGFTDHHGYGGSERTGTFDAEQIPEASGLAASRRNPGWLYVVDDGRPREVWAMRTDGSDVRPVPLQGFAGRDTEALAVGPCDAGRPDPCVYVGDIGDNFHDYPDVAILRFPEPDLTAAPAPVVPDTVRVRYPDGPVDAEALLVDDAGGLYIVTKEAGEDGTGAARLFRSAEFADGTLDDLGTVPVPEPPLPLAAAVLGVVVTGGDYGGGRVLLRTYDSVVEYVAPGADAPLSDFPTWPARTVPAAREPQSEAVAYAADGCGYYTLGEQVGDIWFVGCRR